MKEEVISFKTAKLAKEKGFDWETHSYFSKPKYSKEYEHLVGFDDDYWGNNYYYDWNTNGEPFKPFSKDCYSIPTQSLLQKWLREEHKIYVTVDVSVYEEPERFAAEISGYGERGVFMPVMIDGFTIYNNYEQALEEGLYQALKLIKN